MLSTFIYGSFYDCINTSDDIASKCRMILPFCIQELKKKGFVVLFISMNFKIQVTNTYILLLQLLVFPGGLRKTRNYFDRIVGVPVDN